MAGRSARRTQAGEAGKSGLHAGQSRLQRRFFGVVGEVFNAERPSPPRPPAPSPKESAGLRDRLVQEIFDAATEDGLASGRNSLCRSRTVGAGRCASR
jgi:hypothetical protein